MATAEPSPAPRYPVRLVALRTGLSPHVLRAWERRYGVVSPTRSEGGQRLYSEHDIERLLRLRQLTDRGHSISRLAPLPLGELLQLEAGTDTPVSASEGLDRLRTGALAKPAPARSADEAVVEALQAARRLDAMEIQAVLERAAVTLGMPVFIDRVVAPLLARIGRGWSEGTVSVAEEHMASAIVRRVLGWLLQLYEVRDAPRLVVATPPHQAHELGALMAATSAAAEGWSVTYLGPDLPVADLVNAAHDLGAWAVAISAVHQPDGGNLVAALRDIRAALRADVVLCVGGTGALQVRAEAEAVGAHVLESLAEFRVMLAGLAHERGL